MSTAYKLAVVFLFGSPALAVLLFEIALNCVAMFNHANIRIPGGIDRTLRLFVVTPDLHRIHRSTDPVEMNRNFGFNSPWWDRVFKTYQDQPARGHESMIVGLNIFRDNKYRALWRMLAIPFH